MPTLPAGHGSLPVEATRFLQRARILDATAQAVAEEGYAATSADRIRRRAGVSSRTFYEHFTDKQDAVLWAFDAAATYAVPRIVAAFAEQDAWAVGVDAALQTYLAIMDCDRAWAVLCLVELPGVATGMSERRDALLAPLIASLSQAVPAGSLVPAADVVAAVDGVVRERLLRDDDIDLQGLRPELLGLTLSPYVGAERARGFIEREPAVPRPIGRPDASGACRRARRRSGGRAGRARRRRRRASRRAGALARGPRPPRSTHPRRGGVLAARAPCARLAHASFFGMPVRDMESAGWGPPTPRERVLRYVAAHPGCSGQEIRAALGFAHLSQVTRVLHALRDEELVARRAPRGRANSWVVTGSIHDSGNTKRDIDGS